MHDGKIDLVHKPGLLHDGFIHSCCIPRFVRDAEIDVCMMGRYIQAACREGSRHIARVWWYCLLGCDRRPQLLVLAACYLHWSKARFLHDGEIDLCMMEKSSFA